MKKYFYIIIISIIFSGFYSCSKEKKELSEKFESTNYKFKISFPKKPSIGKEEDAGGLLVQSFACDQNNIGYVVVAAFMNDFYAEVYEGREDEIITDIRNSMIKNMNAEISKEEKTKFKTKNATYFEAIGKFENTDFQIKGIIFLNFKYIYMILVSSEKSINNDEYEKFIKSFELVK